MAITRQLAAALKALLALTVLLGVLYPAAILAAGLVLPGQANGSLLDIDGKVVGSSLLGQATDAPQWFQARPSASDYSGDTSGGSNLGPGSDELATSAAGRESTLRAANPDASSTVPPDALTASGSGLDPHISPAYAAFQAPRVAKARGMTLEQVEAMIAAHTQRASLGFIGADRVNVTELNLALATSSAAPGQ